MPGVRTVALFAIGVLAAACTGVDRAAPVTTVPVPPTGPPPTTVPAPPPTTVPPTTVPPTTVSVTTAAPPPVLLADDDADGRGAERWNRLLEDARTDPRPGSLPLRTVGILTRTDGPGRHEPLLAGVESALAVVSDRLGGAGGTATGATGPRLRSVRCALEVEGVDACAAAFAADDVEAVVLEPGVSALLTEPTEEALGAPTVSVRPTAPSDLRADHVLGGGCLADLAAAARLGAGLAAERLVVVRPDAPELAACVDGVRAGAGAAPSLPPIEEAVFPPTEAGSLRFGADDLVMLLGRPEECAAAAAAAAAAGNAAPVMGGSGCVGAAFREEPATVGTIVLHEGLVPDPAAEMFADFERGQLRRYLVDLDPAAATAEAGFRAGIRLAEAIGTTTPVLDEGVHLVGAAPLDCAALRDVATACQLLRRPAVWDGVSWVVTDDPVLAPPTVLADAV